MEQAHTEVQDRTANPSAVRDDQPAPVAASVPGRRPGRFPQACSTCGTVPAGNGGAAASPSWIYAIGRIEARFPTLFEKDLPMPRQNTGTIE